jgi:tetratricopeptide (TPR) repeat protein
LAQKTKKTLKSRGKAKAVKTTAKAVKTKPKAVKTTAKAVKTKPKAVKTTGKTSKQTRGKAVSGRPSGKSTAALQKPAAKARKAAVRTGKQKTSKSKKRTIKETKNMEAELKKASLSDKKGSGTNVSQGLLRQTKTTSAALSHLGKGIEFIYKKDFKKARNELTTLVRSFPDETEILARARSYLQICDREDQSQKKPEIAQDQLYALGVLEHNKANYDAAISYFQQSLKKHPDADYIYYSVAASLARKGDLQASLEHLKKAIELNEDSRIFARNDEDFSVFETDEKFSELLGISPNPANEPQ